MDYSRQLRTRYREVQLMARWGNFTFWIGIISVAVVGYLARADLRNVPGGQAGLMLTMTILLIIWLIFRRLDIVLDDENLSFGFWRFRPVVPVREIVSAEPEKITMRKYGGIGIKGGAGAVCYNTRFGDGIRIHVKGRPRDWVFSCDDPQRLLTLLNEDIRKRRGSL